MSNESILDVQEYLPHRYPMLLVDKVLSIDFDAAEGPTLTALKNVSHNEEFFNGHFKGHPIMPAVLILEAMAQASGLLGMAYLGAERTEKTIYYFAGSDKARFKRPIVPGDQVILESICTYRKRNLWKFECRALVDGEVACQADILCSRRELP